MKTPPPINTPIMLGNGINPIWASWFDQIWQDRNLVVAPVAAAGVTPPGTAGQVYITSTGILATYNGTDWVQYDGTPVVF